MAVCLTVMMGRLGGMVGVNMVALLIENHCELTFGIASVIVLVCGLCTFAIPNIMKPTPVDSAGQTTRPPQMCVVATVEGAMHSPTGKGSFGQLTQ